MRKADALKRWKSLDEGRNPLKVMRPIPYKAEGSRYGACGIRIDGTPEFIDAVLSNLKALIDGENQVTRLELARKTVSVHGNKTAPNACPNAECCYIRLHMRGREGAIAAAAFGENEKATVRFADIIGAEV